jgi:hypothetical protein
MNTERVSGSALLVVLALALACSGSEKESAPEPEQFSMTPNPVGVWTIVAHRIPGVSAMTDSTAAAWHGLVLTYEENRAAAGSDTCRAASYGFETRPADRFLGESYHIAPFTLGIEAKTLDVMWVGCGGSPWNSPGGVLIWIDRNRAFTPWDGVFFELRRGVSAPVIMPADTFIYVPGDTTSSSRTGPQS